MAGAGIVGVSTAIWLQRFGYQVKLIDRIGPASGTSYGNAGILASGSIIPVTTPGLISKSPGMLINPNKPLFLKYAYLPRSMPFLFKYLRYANIEHVQNYATAMSQLLYDTVDQHKALARGTGAERYIENNDYLFGYDTEKAFEKDRFAWDLRRKHQHDFDILKGDALHNVDPIYDGSFKVVVVNRNHDKINDPGEYIKKLAEHFVDNKGEIIQANIKDFQQKDASIIGLETDRGVHKADHVFEAVGKRALQSAAIDYCCSGGAVTFVGLDSEDATINLQTTAITRAEKTISGSIYGSACTDKDFLLYGEKFLDGDLPVDLLVNRRYQLKEINIALTDMQKGKPGRGLILFDN